MKKLETKYICKCGATRNVRWFSSEELGSVFTVESKVCCLKCLAEIDMTATVKFNVSDVEDFLVIWDEVPA